MDDRTQHIIDNFAAGFGIVLGLVCFGGLILAMLVFVVELFI